MTTKQEQPKTAPVVQNDKGNNLQMAQMQQALIQNNLLMEKMQKDLDMKKMKKSYIKDISMKIHFVSEKFII